MSTDEYVPTTAQVRGRYSDGAHFQGVPEECDDQSLAAFDAWLARVRRDAAREALDGYAGSLDILTAPFRHLEGDRVRHWRDTYYPEGADSD